MRIVKPTLLFCSSLLALILTAGCTSTHSLKNINAPEHSKKIQDWLNEMYGLSVRVTLNDQNGELRVHGPISEVKRVGKIIEVANVAVGEFDALKGTDTLKLLFPPQFGILEKYLNGVKTGEAKWKVSKKGGIHATYDDNIVPVYMVRGFPDYKIIEIAQIDEGGNRDDYPKDKQVTYKYSINNLPFLSDPLKP